MSESARPAVTVALPYAKEPFAMVRSALESILAQRYPSWRAVVVDDSANGSDQVAELVRSFGDPRFSYQRYDGPHGIGYAWNACVDRVDTELFCLLHTDDELEQDYLARMLELAAAYPAAAMYFSAARIINEDGVPCFSLADRVKDLIAPRSEPMVLSGPSAVRRLAVGDFIMCPTMMYRTAALGPRRFSTSHKFVLDLRFILDVLYAGGVVVGTHQRIYRYRRHSKQETSYASVSGQRFEEEVEVLREIELVARDKGWRSVRWAARARPTFRLNVAYQILQDVAKRRGGASSKLRYLLA